MESKLATRGASWYYNSCPRCGSLASLSRPEDVAHRMMPGAFARHRSAMLPTRVRCARDYGRVAQLIAASPAAEQLELLIRALSRKAPFIREALLKRFGLQLPP